MVEKWMKIHAQQKMERFIGMMSQDFFLQFLLCFHQKKI